MPTGSLPSEGKKLYERVYDERKKAGDSEEKAARIAWTAVKNAGWSKDEDGNWTKKSMLVEYQLAITKASYDAEKDEMRIRFVGSDTDEDVFGERMSVQLFDDFIERIEDNEPLDMELKTLLKERGWDGGMPYISISHLKSGTDGKNIPADVLAVYRDGNRLKGKAVMRKTAIGRAAYESIRADRDGTSTWKDKIRISIGFIDYAHAHGNVVFERKSIYDVCPMCEVGAGDKVYLKGKLVHFALTRRPANERTQLEVDKMADEITTRGQDAASIVGEELVSELETKSTLTDAPAMVVKAEEEKVEEPIQEEKTEVVEETPAPVAEKSEMSDKEDDMEEEEKKKKKKEEMAEEKSELDVAYSELKSVISTAKSIEEVQAVFNKLGEVVQKSYVPPTPEPQSDVLKALSALTNQISALSEKLGAIETDMAVLKAKETKPVQHQSVEKATIPAPLSIRPTQEMIERGVNPTPVTKKFSIKELAEMSTRL